MVDKIRWMNNLRKLRVNFQNSNKEKSLVEIPVPVAIILDDITKALELSALERRYILGAKTEKEIESFWKNIEVL